VYILHADDIFFEQKPEGLEQLLIGDIALFQDSTFFYCDTALILNNRVWANGNIQILQGDSTRLFSDSLYYSGDDKQAKLFGEVILQERENALYTDELIYELEDREAKYVTGGLLKRDGTSIKSGRGKYYLKEDLVALADSVVIVDSNFVLQADTLEFDMEDKRAVFVGPTSIAEGENEIYCETGYYSIDEGRGEFSTNAGFVRDGQKGEADKMIFDDSLKLFRMIGNARLWKEDQNAEGDSIVYFQEEKRAELFGNAKYRDSTRALSAEIIYYDQTSDKLTTRGSTKLMEGDVQLIAAEVDYDDSTGIGQARGDVEWRDTLNDIAIFSEVLDYNKKSNYVKATGRRPWIELYMEDDTMFVAGDTIISDEEVLAADTSRRIFLYNDVRIFKSDIQGKCDSMVFFEKDSVFTMFDQPLLWSDTSQFSGDTIYIFLRDKTVDRIKQVSESMIVNSNDMVYFNQIGGKEIVSYFKEGKPDYTLVEGNAESLYFATDEEDAYIAGNKSICSRIKVKFNEKKIDNIMFLAEPKAEMLPMSTPGLKEMRLEGYQWKYELRPKSKEDVLR
jgi:lipopolysaccharide assembly outer membrane protein LptD (OstA)